MKRKIVAGFLVLASVLFVSEVFAVCPADGRRVVPPSGIISEPGHYQLCDNFHQPIRITSSDVTLDCADKKVWSTLDVTMPPTQPSWGKHGIWVENDDWWVYNVMISHCDVAGWDSGIRAGYVSGLTLYINKAHHNGDGFDLNRVSWIDARDNDASDNADDGVDLDLVDHATFDNTTAFRNKSKGISINYFDDINKCGSAWNEAVTFQNSTVSDNGDWGFSIKGMKLGKFINNTCQRNIEGGWRLGNKKGSMVDPDKPCGDLDGTTMIDMPNCVPGKIY